LRGPWASPREIEDPGSTPDELVRRPSVSPGE
jgi:hypothetical protein